MCFLYVEKIILTKTKVLKLILSVHQDQALIS